MYEDNFVFFAHAQQSKKSQFKDTQTHLTELNFVNIIHVSFCPVSLTARMQQRLLTS